MRLWGWFRDDRNIPLDSLAESLALMLSQLADVIALEKTGSSAKAIALQRLVPQAASLTIGTFIRKTGMREKSVLHDQLNYRISDVCTGYNFWEAMYGQLFADNNAFALRQAVTFGPILRPIPRGECIAFKPDPKGQPWLINYKWNGTDYPPERIWHLRLHTPDGMIGVPWENELAIFELARITEKLAYRFFARGGNVNRIWKYAGLNTDGKGLASREQVEQQQKLLNEILRHQAGKTGNVVVPSYFEHKDTDLSLREGQMLETRKHQSGEVLNLYGVDPEKPGDLESLYTVAFVPVLECVEQAITRDLLTPAQRTKYKVAYIAEGRFRGNIAAWLNALKAAVEGTILLPNDARRLSGLGLDDVDGGDTLINPNTMPAAVSTGRRSVGGGSYLQWITRSQQNRRLVKMI